MALVKQKTKTKVDYISGSSAQTKFLGRFLAKKILKNSSKKQAFILALNGELGAGKTNFVQGFAEGLGIKEIVNSPTFTIFKKYNLKNNFSFKYFFHIDCYRLGSVEDLALLGVDKIFSDRRAIVAIEWPDLAFGILPQKIFKINFEISSPGNRRISMVF